MFRLGKDDVCVVVDPEGSDDEVILDAARSCPVDAITLLDEFEEQIWPVSPRNGEGAMRSLMAPFPARPVPRG